MTGRETLGEFEHLVLLAVARVGTDAGGAAIHEELARVADRNAALAAIYVTLARLEQKGLVRSRTVPAPRDRGGRSRRVFTLSRSGLAELRRTRETLERMWTDVPALTPRPQ